MSILLTLKGAQEKSETTVEELKQYCDDVILNKVISCKKHKWACERFLRDLTREGQKDFPYF